MPRGYYGRRRAAINWNDADLHERLHQEPAISVALGQSNHLLQQPLKSCRLSAVGAPGRTVRGILPDRQAVCCFEAGERLF
jgi:hypothetical protein